MTKRVRNPMDLRDFELEFEWDEETESYDVYIVCLICEEEFPDSDSSVIELEQEFSPIGLALLNSVARKHSRESEDHQDLMRERWEIEKIEKEAERAARPRTPTPPADPEVLKKRYPKLFTTPDGTLE